jgi:hypothetical protein
MFHIIEDMQSCGLIKSRMQVWQCCMTTYDYPQKRTNILDTRPSWLWNPPLGIESGLCRYVTPAVAPDMLSLLHSGIDPHILQFSGFRTECGTRVGGMYRNEDDIDASTEYDMTIWGVLKH